MTQSDNVIKLLLVEDSVDLAEQLVSDLRNGGIAVHLARVTNEAELIEHLRARAPDLILANMNAAHLPLAQVGAIVQRSGKDSSLIAMSSDIDVQCMLQAVQAGAWAHILLGQAELLQHIVRRELGSLSTRRAVSQLKTGLHESQRRCDSLLDSSRDPIAYVHEGMHVRANQAYLEIFGFTAVDQIESLSILDLIAPVDAENFRAALKRMDKNIQPTQILNLKALRIDGVAFDAQIELSGATYEGESCQQIIFRRQAANEEMAKQLEALRARDPVTGLYNRQHCIAALERISTNNDAECRDHALLLIEPDNFKHLTDTLGLDVTDLLLSELAHHMQRHLGTDDIAGRFGTQTLGMLSAFSSIEQVQELGEILRRECEERIFELGAKSVSLTISVGVSIISNKSTNAASVLARANDALQVAQVAGGNRVHFIDPAAEEKADEAEALQWRERIKAALANNDFQLHYQSVISLQGVSGDFREILLRMRSPEGEIKPLQFFPIAQRYGLLPAIDRWVISHSLGLLTERSFNDKENTFFIKISLVSLEDETLLPWLATQLEAKKIPGSALVFEVHEQGAVTALKQVLNFTHGIKKLGCKFALEGFAGTQTGLQLLKHTDADYLKIDRSFMRDLPRNKENESKIRTICTQMRNMGKLTIAEFVEDATSMSILFSCGVDFVQGNFLQESKLVMSESISA